MRIQSTVLFGALLATTAVLGQGLTDGVSSVTTAPGDSTAEGPLPTLATTSADGAGDAAGTGIADSTDTAVEGTDTASASASASGPGAVSTSGSSTSLAIPSASGVTGAGGTTSSSNTTAGGNSTVNGTESGNSTGGAFKIAPLAMGLQVLYGPAALLLGALGAGLAVFA